MSLRGAGTFKSELVCLESLLASITGALKDEEALHAAEVPLHIFFIIQV